MIKLHQFVGGPGLPNYSPFCIKLECYLRMADIPYEAVTLHDPRKAPKGKGPFIEHDGKRIGDSSLIIDYLKHRFGNNPDGWLNEEQHAVSLAFQALMEEHLYWCIVYGRWMEEENFAELKKAFFGVLPPVMRKIVPQLIQRDVRKALWNHGLGRHSRDEIYEFGKRDIKALSDYLNDKPYFHGNHISMIDAVVYGAVASILYAPFDTPMVGFLAQQTNLVRHCEKIQEQFFPELTRPQRKDAA